MAKERKYIVFVSSTMVDLKMYRQKVIESIIRLQQIPFSMEYFPATSSAALDFIDEQIRKSDIFLLLLGQSIGTKVGDETFIQYEYRIAEKYGKDILVLTLSEDRFKETAITEFRTRIGRGGSTSSPIISTFSTEEEAGNQAYYALSNLVKRKNEESRGGWIEATPYDKVGGPFFDRYLEFFTSLEKFNLRTKREHTQKVSIGNYIWEVFIPKIDTSNPVQGIYFESGSSTAYAAYELLEFTRRNAGYWTNQCGMKDNLKIITNNFFTLLDFTTYQNITKPINSIILYPQGPFSKDYGATYGPIHDMRPDDNSIFLEDGWQLNAEARQACENVTREVDQLLGDRGLIIMAVSGIDWSDRHIRGPHVGSYHNMLMKRSLLHSRHAKIIILDDTKWRKAFDDNECFPVCGDGMQWSKVLREDAIAFAIGAERDEDGILQTLRDMEFLNIRMKRRETGVTDIVAYNNVFKQWLEEGEHSGGNLADMECQLRETVTVG